MQPRGNYALPAGIKDQTLGETTESFNEDAAKRQIPVKNKTQTIRSIVKARSQRTL